MKYSKVLLTSSIFVVLNNLFFQNTLFQEIAHFIASVSVVFVIVGFMYLITGICFNKENFKEKLKLNFEDSQPIMNVMNIFCSALIFKYEGWIFIANMTLAASLLHSFLFIFIFRKKIKLVFI